jgi:hypothetical protein
MANLLVWIGALEDCRQAQNTFWPALRREGRKRRIECAEVIGLNKMVSAYVSAARKMFDQLLPVLQSFRIWTDSPLCLTARDQTLARFGFDPADLNQFALTLPVARGSHCANWSGSRLQYCPGCIQSGHARN